jgi:hypothetical protein
LPLPSKFLAVHYAFERGVIESASSEMLGSFWIASPEVDGMKAVVVTGFENS